MTVPSIRPPVVPAVPLVAAPVVVDCREPVPAAVEPVEFAVPRLFVPTEGDFALLPAPLGSLTELFSPPTFPGPFGTPLTLAVPAPAADGGAGGPRWPAAAVVFGCAGAIHQWLGDGGG